MRYRPSYLLVLMLCPALFDWAATLSLVDVSKTNAIFSGSSQRVSTVWQNVSSEPAQLDVGYVLTQASSATAAPLGRFSLKPLKAYPGQSFIAFEDVEVPAVKVETRFLLQWRDPEGKVLGTTDLLAYPPSKILLQKLKPLASGEPLGVLDPSAELKYVLQNAEIELSDLQGQELANFAGKLLILGPFKSRDEMQSFTKETVLKLAMKGAAIVWLQPPPAPHLALQPSFQKIAFGKGAVVLVQREFLPDLVGNPESQFKLIQLCTTAVSPNENDPFQLLSSKY